MNEPTIQRCPHDSPNPYAQINRFLIRDESLHPCVRWLLIYMLSMKDGWVIKPAQIREHCKKHFGCGRDKIYDWINEACEAGYMFREEWLEKGKKRYKYYVSETPKFKKSLLFPEPQDTEAQFTAKADSKEEHVSSKEDTCKKEHNTLLSEVASQPPTSPEATELAHYLLKRRKEHFPTFKDPKMPDWVKQIRLMHERDGRSWEEIRQAIDFAMDDAFWCKNILSADKLRKQFEKLYAKMTVVNNKGTQIEKCREIAIEIKNVLNKRNGKNGLQIFKTKCFIGEKNEELSFSMNPDIFEEILIKTYGLKKNG